MIDSLIRYLRALSPRAEFTAVMLAAFGYFSVTSVLEAFSLHPMPGMTDAHLRSLVAYELPVLVAILWFLALRGWTTTRLGLKFRLTDIAIGIGLATVDYVIYGVLLTLLAIALPFVQHAIDGSEVIAGDLRVRSVIMVSTVNPLFEEMLVCAYVICAVNERRSMSVAINVSVGVRLVYHLYQGVIAVASAIPMGLLCAYWFAQTGRLWPLIVMHAALDLLALLPYVKL